MGGGAGVSLVKQLRNWEPTDDKDRLLSEAANRIVKLEAALERIRDCNFIITLPDRMDAVRAIAREALE